MKPRSVSRISAPAMRASMTSIITRQPTNWMSELSMPGRLFARPCCTVETSFVMRLKISPCVLREK